MTPTHLGLCEQDPPFPPLGQGELHRLRIGDTARGQTAHVGHGMSHGSSSTTAHQSGDCGREGDNR